MRRVMAMGTLAALFMAGLSGCAKTGTAVNGEGTETIRTQETGAEEVSAGISDPVYGKGSPDSARPAVSEKETFL